MKTFYIILPKIEAYQFKDDNMKSNVRQKVKKWIDICIEHDFKLVAFAEDELMLHLFPDEDRIQWTSVLDEGDAICYASALEEITKGIYRNKRKQTVDIRFLKEAKTKFKLPSRLNRDMDECSYEEARHNVMIKRLKHALNSVLEEGKQVIYFKSNGNNQCRNLEAKEGDGKFLVTEDLDFWLTFYDYGGVQLTVDEANMVLGSM